MKNYFIFEESPYNPGLYLIKPNFALLPLHGFNNGCGSYNILPARICNLKYAEYLRMCRDNYSAKIIGKNYIYPIPYFSKPNYDLLKILNFRAERLLKN